MEGDLKQGAMILYQGMCVGVMSSPLPTSPSNTRDALRLMPCSEGYVYWKQDTPGGYLTITHSGCSAANPPAVCYVGMASRGPALEKSVWVIDTRLSAMASSRVILTSGWANYTVVEEATGAYQHNNSVQGGLFLQTVNRPSIQFTGLCESVHQALVTE